MAPRTEQQFEIIRKDKRKLILTHAMKLFAENGYTGSSMSQLAKHAGISKGLIYNYFKNKEEVLSELIKDGLLRMIAFFELSYDIEINDVVMKKIIDKTFEMIEVETEFWKVYFAVMMQPAAGELAIKLASEQESKFNLLFAEYFKNKGILNPLEEAIFIGSIFDGVSLNYLYKNKNYSKDYAKKRLYEILKIT